MLKILDETKYNLLAIRAGTYLRKEDYDKINPLIDKIVKEYGKVSLYLELEKMDGISAKALYKDVKTSVKHFNDFERIAVVGDKEWKNTTTEIVNLLTPADVKYFNYEEILQAKEWASKSKIHVE